MAAFNYDIVVTGDCNNLGTGAISVTLTGGVAPYTVEFITPYIATFTNVYDTVTVTGLFAAIYTVRVNDSTLPTNNEFYLNIPVSEGLCITIDSDISTSIQDTTCGEDNGSVTVSSESNYSSIIFYLYDEGDNVITSALTNNQEYEFNGLSAGTYYIVAEDLGACTARTANFLIEDSTSFTYGLYVVPNSGCGGVPLGKIFVTGQTGTPPYTYLWSNGETGSSITGLTSGFYSVDVTDSQGCIVSQTAFVPNVDPVGFGFFEVTPPTCFNNDGGIILHITGGTGPYYYSASTGDFLISYSQSYSLTGLSSGVYSFSVTDASLCTFQVSTSLSSPGGIQSYTIETNNSTCSSQDGSIVISVVGGTAPYTYTIVYPSSDTESVNTYLLTYTFDNLSGGTYGIFIEDSSGCNVSDEVTILTEDKFTIALTSTGTTCNENNGSIRVTVSTGATYPLTYYLDGNQVIIDSYLSAVTFNNVSSGLHEVSVVDYDGCEVTETIDIGTSTALIFTLYPTSCLSGNQGTITAFITSGTPPYTFQWSENVPGNPQQIQVTGLTAGTYSLEIVDSNDCSLIKTTEITCESNFNNDGSGYYYYVMGEDVFVSEPNTECSLLGMLNEGYFDLTSGDTGCTLVSAVFTVNINASPIGFTGETEFYTSSSLLDVPSDELYRTTVRDLLLTIPGIGSVVINNDNTITINTIPGDQTLNNAIITIDVEIDYFITCI